MKNKGDGKKGPRDLIPTVSDGEGKVDKEIQKLEEILSTDSTDKAFRSQEVLSAIRMIILSDPEIMDNAMRYALPDKRYCVAAASLWRKLKKHNYDDGIEQLKLLLGLLCSVKGDRINRLVEAVIGEQKVKAQSGSFSAASDKIKQWAFGNR